MVVSAIIERCTEDLEEKEDPTHLSQAPLLKEVYLCSMSENRGVNSIGNAKISNSMFLPRGL